MAEKHPWSLEACPRSWSTVMFTSFHWLKQTTRPNPNSRVEKCGGFGITHMAQHDGDVKVKAANAIYNMLNLSYVMEMISVLISPIPRLKEVRIRF